ncbi:LysR family transcriptional regulator [Ramlibacter sp.]|uniref:LysR family transcriptional regulator n=1 Tax=Ramlibacter sp. TaxID=1917967 RepID=UPI003D1039C1
MTANLRQVRAFLAVARHSSFTRAASELHISQPALTVQIRQLESALGLRLFDRNTRTVEITRAGRELAMKFERLQDEFDAVLAETRDIALGLRGVVRLACLQSFASTVLPQAVARFQREHPRIGFSVKDASGTRTVDMVRSGEVDFGVADMATAGDPQLEVTPLLEARLHALLPAGHALARARRLTLARLADCPLVLLDRETSARRLVDAAIAQSGLALAPACEVMTLASAVAMVRSGGMVAVLPVSSRDAPMYLGVTVKPLADDLPTRWMGIVKKAGRSLPPPSEAFIRQLLASCRDG